ncbi:MAG: BCCT family transporter, partial [Actinomycetota bacterium]|nr:BCCT family transporter [Actinomycetota bacterium]
MSRYLRRHTNPPVFIISGVVILAFVAAGVLFTGATETVAGAVQGFITTYFGWFYIIGVSLLLIFTIGLLFTRYGRVRLGPDDSRPEFSTWAWFAMLFTAGMGI